MKPVRVIAFGAFDPLHGGHEFLLKQAKSLGDYLIVVVARDTSIRRYKGRDPFQDEETRLKAVAVLPSVDQALLGNRTAHTYELLSELDFDIVAMGYDQQPSSEEVRAELDARGKHNAEIVRLPAWKPEVYKSTILRRNPKLETLNPT